MKLFKVELQGHGKFGTVFVVAQSPNDAYDKVRKYLDENNLCFDKERELYRITLIGDENFYSGIVPLFICP